jgi:hypothetical protein
MQSFASLRVSSHWQRILGWGLRTAMLSTKARQVGKGGTISRYETFPLPVRIVSLDIAGIVVHIYTGRNPREQVRIVYSLILKFHPTVAHSGKYSSRSSFLVSLNI